MNLLHLFLLLTFLYILSAGLTDYLQNHRTAQKKG